ncbi:unnamed protein product [Lymnaea stagnalis]|uniref:Uncharacterized protein n=1 Tax=Lymnaea stagnalis TaxID=6523 RepID=A0AAV2HI12_LYMST
MRDTRNEVLPVPDVTSALLLRELGLELDPVQRLENLQKRRKETIALRQLWRTLKARELRNELHGEWRGDLTSRRWEPSPPNVPHQLFKDEDAAVEISPSRPPASLVNRDGPDGELVHRSLQARKTGPAIVLTLSTTRLCKSAPFESDHRYAGANQRGAADKVKAVRDGDEFNALNRKLIRSLPNVYDAGSREPGYITRDITEWKNEVRKVVPDRPRMFVPVHVRPRSMSNGLPAEVRRFPSCFFKYAGNLTVARSKDYVINPEWPSERLDRSKTMYVGGDQ